MRFIAAALVGAFAFSAEAQLQFHGFLTAREVRARAPQSWVEGGFGKFDIGDDQTATLGVAQVGFDWTPRTWILVHADGVVRSSRAAGQGRNAGVVQAYVDFFNDHWRLRAGHFWLPTSRENIEPMWTSPYTITFSALNTWNGEEVRPIGADLQFSPNFYVTVGGTIFRGNDTMGTLMAARGWTLGNRLTTYNEVVPAVPDTTRPFGSDLDSRDGFSERLRLQLPERAMIQFAHVDNRAEIGKGRPPEEPWLTKYNTIGTTIGTTSPTTFVAEWLQGDTTVGFPRGTFKLGFNTAYALLSHKAGSERYTIRIERFATDFSTGHGITVAAFHDVSAKVRTGLEYARASGKNGGNTITFELRYGF